MNGSLSEEYSRKKEIYKLTEARMNETSCKVTGHGINKYINIYSANSINSPKRFIMLRSIYKE